MNKTEMNETSKLYTFKTQTPTEGNIIIKKKLSLT